MPTNPNRSTVRGSDRVVLHGVCAIGPVPKDERFEVTVRVRRRRLSRAWWQTASTRTNCLESPPPDPRPIRFRTWRRSGRPRES